MPTLNSSNLKSCAYDDESQRLSITFHNGRTYVFSGVPRSAYEGLLSAPSAGKYFNSAIKGHYTTERS